MGKFAIIFVMVVAAFVLWWDHDNKKYIHNRISNECREGPGGNAATGECG